MRFPFESLKALAQQRRDAGQKLPRLVWALDNEPGAHRYTRKWIADQMGHTSTAMIFKHYAKWISEDGPDVVGLLNQALRLT